jgi:hypothetical protein
MLQWCDSEPRADGQSDEELKGRIGALMSAHQGGSEVDPGVHGTLVGLLLHWEATSAVAIQATYGSTCTKASFRTPVWRESI